MKAYYCVRQVCGVNQWKEINTRGAGWKVNWLCRSSGSFYMFGAGSTSKRFVFNHPEQILRLQRFIRGVNIVKPDRQWRSSSFQEYKKVRVSRNLWPWPWPWVTMDARWSGVHLVKVWWRSGHLPARRSDLRKSLQTDRRRTPRHCISSFLEWANKKYNAAERFLTLL